MSHHRHNVLVGALLIIASEWMFASMGAAIKAVTASLPQEVAVFMRNLFGLVVLGPVLLHRRSTPLRSVLATDVLSLHLLRAAAGLGAMYCFFYSLANLPLAEATLLKMTAPLFLPFMALLWLKEGTAAGSVLAASLGFAGVGLVLRPDVEIHPAMLAGLAGGLLAAVAKSTVRRLGVSEPPARIVFYFALFGAAASSMPLFWSWRTPDLREWAWLAAVGLFGTVGQLFMSRGYALAPAARIGPFSYFLVIFGSAYGYLFWGESLDASFLAGAAIIAFAGVMAVRLRPPARAVTAEQTAR